MVLNVGASVLTLVCGDDSYTFLQIFSPTSHWYCPAPAREMLVRCTTLGRRAGVGTLWAGTWDYDFKSHVMVSDSEPVELLLVLVPLDAVQGLPMHFC